LALFLNINEEYPPADIIVEYGKCIYQGIEALHRRKMMHRNVTVDNVLVHTENGVVHVWLNDFDLVREVPDEIANMTYCGKKEYMAPEIESGEYGKQVDIFSLGMTLYILMTKNQSTMGHYKSHEERLQVIQHNMESTNMYDSSLINTVMQMLHRDPSLRCVPESWQSKYKTYNAVANPSPFEQTLVFKTKDTESRFTVIKRIGESNATVDLCLSETGEKVAVKKITVQQSRKFPNPKTVCDLIIEGVDLIREHRMSTINEVRDCYYFKERETTHAVYIVLEYIEHGELDQYIRSMTKPLPELMVVKILQQLVSALSLLHAKNIVHRDIKVCWYSNLIVLA
jgi:serine/threonine protein kinase